MSKPKKMFDTRFGRLLQNSFAELKALNWLLAAFLVAGVFLVVVCMPDTAKGTAFAAGIALIVAVVIYPWQKEKDRLLKVREERRNAYAAFFRASENYFTLMRSAALVSVKELPDLSKDYAGFESAKSGVFLYGTKRVTDASRLYARALNAAWKALKSEKDERKKTDTTDDLIRNKTKKRAVAFDKCYEARKQAVDAARLCAAIDEELRNSPGVDELFASAADFEEEAK